MTSRTEQLAIKRRALQLRCALQRQQLVFMSATLESQLAGPDRLLNLFAGIAKNPWMVMAAVAGFVVIKPWRWFGWASRGWALFALAKKFYSWTAKES